MTKARQRERKRKRVASEMAERHAAEWAEFERLSRVFGERLVKLYGRRNSAEDYEDYELEEVLIQLYEERLFP